MKHASQTDFGRAVKLCPPNDEPGCDKWEALSLLSEVSESYGLSHRSLGVLRALLSFLPTRAIHPEPARAVVFPSNRTLSARLNGMPESTLRRHLAALVKAGIVSRQDSPNRKRYARRSRMVGEIAFGFDLSPLAREIEALRQAAQSAQIKREALAVLRSELGMLRHQLIAQNGPCPLAEDAFKLMRRKPEETELKEMIHHISAQLDTADMSGADSQNERHIQIEKINISEEDQRQKCEDMALMETVDMCKEYQSYFPTTPRHWHDVIALAGQLAPMVGIDKPVLDEAMRIMGLKKAAVCVLVILERLGSIDNPGGYLRRLTQTARSGAFSARKLLQSLTPRQKLSADNLEKRDFSTA